MQKAHRLVGFYRIGNAYAICVVRTVNQAG